MTTALLSRVNIFYVKWRLFKSHMLGENKKIDKENQSWCAHVKKYLKGSRCDRRSIESKRRVLGSRKRRQAEADLGRGAGVRGRVGRLHLWRPWAAARRPAGSAMERQKRAESGAEWRWRKRGVSSNYLPSSGVLRRGPPLGRLR